MCVKLYWNKPRFVKDMTKTFWSVFRFCRSLAKCKC